MASQLSTDHAWLDLTYRITRAAQASCICSLTGARWSGYLGERFVDARRPRARVLFVGANHNPNGLAATPAIAEYNVALLKWANTVRSPAGDHALLSVMRASYKKSWPAWGAVWQIFKDIRSNINVSDDAFAFVNLARCPEPIPATDDQAIAACQQAFPLADLVEAIDAKVIFLAKSGPVGQSVTIPGERTGERYVVRYGNGSRGQRAGARHYSHWMPDECALVNDFINGKTVPT